MNISNNLNKAKKNKNDEFYTQLTDIEKEVVHYKNHFKDKIIFCNCDDPEWSNFWKYFSLNFEFLGLKKLIATHFDYNKPTYKLEIEREREREQLITRRTNLSQNGDFRSDECIELLKEADIIVTNPPFSLFREYISQLIKYNKKFLIIGNYNSCGYKEIFPLIQNNKIWIGVSPRSMTFKNSDGNFSKVNAVWFTNLDHNKRHEEMILYKIYDENNYKKYDNYDAINIDKIKNIPINYYGLMGVPLTFLEKYNPNQFQIVGNEITLNIPKGRGYINGKRLYSRIFIKWK